MVTGPLPISKQEPTTDCEPEADFSQLRATNPLQCQESTVLPSASVHASEYQRIAVITPDIQTRFWTILCLDRC